MRLLASPSLPIRLADGDAKNAFAVQYLGRTADGATSLPADADRRTLRGWRLWVRTELCRATPSDTSWGVQPDGLPAVLVAALLLELPTPSLVEQEGRGLMVHGPTGLRLWHEVLAPPAAEAPTTDAVLPDEGDEGDEEEEHAEAQDEVEEPKPETAAPAEAATAAEPDAAEPDAAEPEPPARQTEVRPVALPTKAELVKALFEAALFGAPQGRIDGLMDDVRRRFPFARRQAEQQVREGRSRREVRDQAEAAVSKARTSAELDQVLDKWSHKMTERQGKKWAARTRAYQLRRRFHNHGPGQSTVQPRGDHRLPALAPSAAWRLYIDETGSRFAPGGKGKEGRVVVLAVPDGTPPPTEVDPLFHAVDAPSKDTDHVVQAVLDRPVGVLGVTSAGVLTTRGQDYDEALLETLLLTLRLLPLPEEGEVSVTAFMEARGVQRSVDFWDAARRGLRRELALGDPDRERRLVLDLRPVAKGETRGTAMADAIAYTWGATLPDAKARREKWGLGPCLLNRPKEVEVLRAAFNSFGPRRQPSGQAWAQLLGLHGADDPGAPVGYLLARLADQTRQSPTLWQRYLAAGQQSIEVKGFDLGGLQRQVAWLAGAAPAGWTPPPRLALLQGMHALATGNHAGSIEADAENRLLADAAALRDEDVRLACLTALHVAVRRTNRYAFAAATDAVAGWEDVAPIALGYKLRGRLLSTLGQHHAFQGQVESAVQRFDQALAAFDQISDPTEGAAERAQTGTYRTLALLDQPDRMRSTAALTELFGSLDEATVRRVARGTDDHTRWHHHLLVRWLAEAGDDRLRRAYLAESKKWGGGAQHPWPLIETYRAVLAARHAPDLVKGSIGFASEPLQRASGTLGLIAAAIARLGERLGVDTQIRPDLAALARQMPDARPWIARLEALPRSGDPLEPLRVALPFNFR